MIFIGEIRNFKNKSLALFLRLMDCFLLHLSSLSFFLLSLLLFFSPPSLQRYIEERVLEIDQEEAYLINKEDHFHVIVDGCYKYSTDSLANGLMDLNIKYPKSMQVLYFFLQNFVLIYLLMFFCFVYYFCKTF